MSSSAFWWCPCPSQWPFRLSTAESQLLDRYIQKFSRVYPTCSGPENPFLSVFIPLSMRSQVVLDSLLALSAVQSWENETFVMEAEMLRLRGKALRGCRQLLVDLSAQSHEQARLSITSTDGAMNGWSRTAPDDDILNLLTTSIILLLCEKLTGQGHRDWAPHLQFFAQYFPAHVFSTVKIRPAASAVLPDRSRAFLFLSNLFLYNDIVRSTSLHTPALSQLSNEIQEVQGMIDTPHPCPVPSTHTSGRFYFPQLIIQISTGSSSVTDDEINAWDGRLDWIPSFALVPTHVVNNSLSENSAVSSTGTSFQPTEYRTVSELYRVAAMIFRRQQPTTYTKLPGSDGPDMGSLLYKAICLVNALPDGSPFESALLWPIGIIARELTSCHQVWRETIILRLKLLERRFQMRIFGRARAQLIKIWDASDRGHHYESEKILYG